MEMLIKIKKAKIILACGGVFVGDHANVKPKRRNIANRAVKQIRKIIFGILKSAFPYIFFSKYTEIFLAFYPKRD